MVVEEWWRLPTNLRLPRGPLVANQHTQYTHWPGEKHEKQDQITNYKLRLLDCGPKLDIGLTINVYGQWYKTIYA